MTHLFATDPARLSPRLRRLALLAARFARVVSLVLFTAFIIAALVHFFTGLGNYPEPRHRHAVGALFLCIFAPATLGLHLLARRRVRVLEAFASAPRSDERA
jgi:hypothetical protein